MKDGPQRVGWGLFYACSHTSNRVAEFIFT